MRQLISGDTLAVGDEAECDVSVVCPFYNEEAILRSVVRDFLDRLKRHITGSWELIIVNDGSSDNSLAIAQEIAHDEPNLRVLTYRRNRGRGHALRVGISQARGEIIVTTEIDLSWGDDIVERLLAAIDESPDVDIVVASPHLKGGGYRNVPRKRVFYSTFGNWIIRACMSNVATMNTGMTRAYRRDAIRALPCEENGKEFHLEAILKARALNYRFREIPALLEWKEHKFAGQAGGRPAQPQVRKSKSSTNKLIFSHTLFSLFANPIRYIWGMSAASFLIALVFIAYAVVRFATGQVSVFMVIIGLALGIISLMLFAFGVVFQQGNMVQKQLWRLQRDLATGPPLSEGGKAFYFDVAERTAPAPEPRRKPVAVEGHG
ncbi:glycosyltransferase family 2 protein [Ferruginivarius sediminum]|nr:glycosyltransferase family 2 protein [Ferruginivarius sediminum]